MFLYSAIILMKQLVGSLIFSSTLQEGGGNLVHSCHNNLKHAELENLILHVK